MKCVLCGSTESSRWREDKYCNSCYAKQWRINNTDNIVKYDRTVARRFRRANRNAKKRNLDWLIQEEDFEKLCNKPCYYCNDKLSEKNSGTGLDRIDNDKGYEINNVVPSCKVCNIIRGQFLSVEETKQVIELVLKLRDK